VQTPMLAAAGQAMRTQLLEDQQRLLSQLSHRLRDCS
jgi:hypothetical protein